jgi:hypothetical protein
MTLHSQTCANKIDAQDWSNGKFLHRPFSVCNKKILKQPLEPRTWVLVYMQLILDYTMHLFYI